MDVIYDNQKEDRRERQRSSYVQMKKKRKDFFGEKNFTMMMMISIKMQN